MTTYLANYASSVLHNAVNSLRLGAFIDDVGTTVLAWIDFLIDLVVKAFSGVVEIFYGSPDGVLPAELTIPGMLLLFGLAMTFLMLAIGFITRLIKK